MAEGTPTSTSVRRLRVFDLASPWFWLVIFYRRQYGAPRVEAQLYGPPGWCRGWFHGWQWELEPDRTIGAEAVHD